MLEDILNAYGLKGPACRIEGFGSGLINSTLKVYSHDNTFILQRLNTSVFKSPEAIAGNLQLVDDYLKKHHPGYLFAAPLPTLAGNYLIQSADGSYYRLLPFIEGSHTVDAVETEKEAFEAAKQFGKFSRLLNDFDSKQLKYTLPGFHNLELRFAQFETAFKAAGRERLEAAEHEIKGVELHVNVMVTYRGLIKGKRLPLRVMHHDTKINNVLFDDDNNGLCVIDLDTIMPGYFLSDVGDMMRTYLSPVSEEETDLDKILVRKNIYNAIYEGYMAEMGDVLTAAEKEYFKYSGQMMIYMQALRFLTDYLNNDVYYGSKYPGQNLMRAKNQFRLLKEYNEL